MNIGINFKKGNASVENKTIGEKADVVWKSMMIIFISGIALLGIFSTFYFLGIDTETFIDQNENTIAPKQIDQSKLNRVLQYFTEKDMVTKSLPVVDLKQ